MDFRIYFIAMMVLTEINCCPIFKDTLGATSPPNDIFLKNGSTLQINCTLYPKNFENPSDANVNNIFFRKNGLHEITGSRINILDKYTAQMYIKTAVEEDTGFYQCYIKVPNKKFSSERNEYVCGNLVKIGFPPIKIKKTNFKCVSMNWQNMTCTWKKPKNRIPTTYKLTYFFPISKGRRSNDLQCPQYKTENSCFFGSDIKKFRPVYKQSAQFYIFKLTGTNKLGTSSKLYGLRHYSVVIPDKPVNFRTTTVTKRDATLGWNSPLENELFPPGVNYELFYRSEWSSSTNWTKLRINEKTIKLENLEAHTKHFVKIRCKSRVAKNQEEWWSTFAEIEFTTHTDVPRTAPEITPGMFEDYWFKGHKRNIVLYWKSVPRRKWNGDKFAYRIQYMQMRKQNGTYHQVSQDIQVIRTRAFKWKFVDLNLEGAYKFVIRTTNENGMEPNIYSSIIIDKRSNLPLKPRKIIAKMLKNGSYEVSWEPGHFGDTVHVQSYTIFWCKKHNLYKCAESMDWIQVPGYNTSAVINPKNEDDFYQFSVSMTAEHSSSAMVWASCIVSETGGPGKVKQVRGNALSSTRLEVYWDVDCLQQSGSIIGYFIFVCRLNDRHKCAEPMKKIFSQKKEHILEKLKPYQLYKIMVSSVTMANEESEKSQEFIYMMPEGAPSQPNPPTIDDATNTSISMTWNDPSDLNGVIRFYMINYNRFSMRIKYANKVTIVRNISPYTKYAVSLSACTNAGCSFPSIITYVRTEIGVPGKMRQPSYDIVNSTYAKLYWEWPSVRSGPLDGYQISITWSDNSNNTVQETAIEPWENETYVLVDCSMVIEEPLGMDYYISVRAINSKNETLLFGPWSKPAKLKMCFETIDELKLGFIIGVTFGGTIAFVVITFVSYSITKWAREKINEVKKVNIQLPRGLGDITKLQKSIDRPTEVLSVTNNNIYSEFLMKNALQPTFIDETDKYRHGSGDSAYSSVSTDKMIAKEPESEETEPIKTKSSKLENAKSFKDTSKSSREPAVKTPLETTVSTVLIDQGPNFAAYSKFGQCSIEQHKGDQTVQTELNSGNKMPIIDADSGLETDSCATTDLSLTSISSYTKIGLSNSHTDLTGIVKMYTKLNTSIENINSDSKHSDKTSPYSKFGVISLAPFDEKVHLTKNSKFGYVTVDQVQKTIGKYHKSSLKPLEFKEVPVSTNLRCGAKNGNACRDSGVSISSPTGDSIFNGYVPNSPIKVKDDGCNINGYVPFETTVVNQVPQTHGYIPHDLGAINENSKNDQASVWV